MVAVVDSKWSAWSGWSACSAKCGTGTQSRGRTCIPGNEYGAACSGPATETRSCKGMAVVDSKWTAYGAWGACSAACGAGTQTRTRSCKGMAVVDSKW